MYLTNHLILQECSTVVSNQTVYRSLFDTSMLDRWQKLISDEVKRMEKEIRVQVRSLKSLDKKEKDDFWSQFDYLILIDF